MNIEKSQLIRGAESDFVFIVGLEVHAQVRSKSKLFSSASTQFGAEPNSNVSFIDAGMPGMLPVVNSFCIEQAVKTGLGINAEINLISRFDRKNYFYPDLPQGYQISQLYEPVVGKGKISIQTEEKLQKEVGIERIHLEQDAGKSIHDMDPTTSFVDLNRTGIALMEIVSKPEINSPFEAVEYIKKLRLIMRYLETCDGNMQEGSLRADVNVSVCEVNTFQNFRKTGNYDLLGTRCEIKNMNSLKFIQQAINFEARRQIKLIESGKQVEQETRLYDPNKNETRPLRSKEDAHDYRYFPDPDLLPVNLSQEQIDKIKPLVGELPQDKLNKYVDNYSLEKDIAKIIIAEKQNANLFEKMISESTVKPKFIAAWLVGDIFAFIKENNLEVNSLNDKTKDITDLLRLISDDVISNKAGKEILPKVLNGEGKPSELVKELGLEQVSDSGELEKIIDEALVGEEENILKFQGGSDRVLGYFVGKCLKATKGKGNPKLIYKILLERLKK